MAQTQSNPYVIYTSNTCFTTARFVTSAGHGSQHVPDWPQIMPKLRRFWEEYAKYSTNFNTLLPIDGDLLRVMIGEPSVPNYVLNEFNAWQSIRRRLAAAQQVLDKNLSNADVVALVKSRYMADMQRELHEAEVRLTTTYHYIYKALRVSESATWGEFLGRKQYKVRLSDEIRALCGEICEDMTRGDRDLYWTSLRGVW